jgi:sucrose porin
VPLENQAASAKTASTSNGYHTLLAYNEPNFYGLAKGASKTGLFYSHALCAQAQRLGTDNLLNDAQALRVFSYAQRISAHWKIAPAFLAEVSKDRFNKGEEYLRQHHLHWLQQEWLMGAQMEVWP